MKQEFKVRRKSVSVDHEQVTRELILDGGRRNTPRTTKSEADDRSYLAASAAIFVLGKSGLVHGPHHHDRAGRKAPEVAPSEVEVRGVRLVDMDANGGKGSVRPLV